MSKTSQQHTQGKHATHSFLASLGVWFTILCWGSAYVAARFLLHPITAGFIPLSPILLAALRFCLASLFFVVPLAQAILRHQIAGRTLLGIALLGQLTFTLYYWLQYIGIQETNASISAILGVGLIPLFTTLLAPLFGEERLNLLLIAILLFGFVGVALIVFQQPLSFALHSGFLLGVGCLITNTLSFGIYNHLSKRWMQNVSPVVLTGGTMISGALGLLVLSLFDRQSSWGELSLLHPLQWGAVLFLAFACSVLAYFLYNRALSTMDASRVAVYFYFEPVVSIVLGIVLLSEQLTWQTVLGAGVITSSVIAVNRLKL